MNVGSQEPGVQTSSRRRIRRAGVLFPLLLIFAVLATVAAPSAFAARAWCKTDPVIMVDGELADVFVSSSLSAPLLVTGPTEIVVSVPVGVSAFLVVSDLGFGKGEIVTFKESRALKVTKKGIQMQIAVMVPSTDSSMPVVVEFAPRILGILSMDRAEGTANKWVYLKVTF
ncbi:MAG TPA: hypothetical protein VMM78_18845 [Thermomicrobiales bacterium]|nr:hypothetical protein [Thermomicrobiales bacterium]